MIQITGKPLIEQHVKCRRMKIIVSNHRLFNRRDPNQFYTTFSDLFSIQVDWSTYKVTL